MTYPGYLSPKDSTVKCFAGFHKSVVLVLLGFSPYLGWHCIPQEEYKQETKQITILSPYHDGDETTKSWIPKGLVIPLKPSHFDHVDPWEIDSLFVREEDEKSMAHWKHILPARHTPGREAAGSRSLVSGEKGDVSGCDGLRDGSWQGGAQSPSLY